MAARERGDSAPTAENLVSWARAFILFHNKRHPRELGLAEALHRADGVTLCRFVTHDSLQGVCLGAPHATKLSWLSPMLYGLHGHATKLDL